MQEISRDAATVTEFGGDMQPAMTVEQGEEFRVKTWDALQGAIYEKGTGTFTVEDVPALNPSPPGFPVNPLGGPIYVEGAEPGDLLAVNIKDIIPADQGWTGTLRPIGMVQDLAGWEECHGWYGIMVDHEPGPSGTTSDGRATLEINDHEWEWDLNPHIGTFATAPARGKLDSLTSQGVWGGNLDVRDVSKGNTVYINSFNEGGMLFMGDVHASQGTETAFANETKAEVIASVDVIEDKVIPGPFRIETPESIIQVECAKNAGTTNKAISGAYTGLMEWLIEEYDYGRREAYIQTSANPNVEHHLYQFFPSINFAVAGVEISKEYL